MMKIIILTPKETLILINLIMNILSWSYHQNLDLVALLDLDPSIHNCLVLNDLFFILFLFVQISRESIDACKDYFRDELTKTDWVLMVELKKLFEILWLRQEESVINPAQLTCFMFSLTRSASYNSFEPDQSEYESPFLVFYSFPILYRSMFC